MAFKMKAGKEGPMYKNYGIGKSPMQKNGDGKKQPLSSYNPPPVKTRDVQEDQFAAAVRRAKEKREEENNPDLRPSSRPSDKEFKERIMRKPSMPKK
tara:strand:- start:1294 stop:1584 length:291 start_codon:yes stop_codon:yes gene_type:complete